MRNRRMLLGVALLGLSLGLSACGLLQSKLLAFSSLTLASGATGTVQLKATALQGLNSLQIGPKGAIRFDPAVVEVTAVEGLGLTVFAHEVDNAAGTVTLAAGSTSGSVANGALVELTLRAVGSSGQSTALRLTEVDLLLNADGEPLGEVKLEPGTVQIQ